MNEYEEKLKSVVKGKVVVYIDAANLEQSVKDMFLRPDEVPEDLKHLTADTLRWSVDYQKLDGFFQTVGDFQGVRFYTAAFDGEGHHRFRYFLDKGLKFKLITKPLKEYEDHTVEAPHRVAKELPPVLSHYFDIANFRSLFMKISPKAKSPEPFDSGPRS